MRKNRYQVEIKKNQSFGLNVTSMTDMFTILLVFLLQNFASAEVQIDEVMGLRLPASKSDKNPVFAVKISISPTELKLEKQLLATLKNNEFTSDALETSDSQFIKPLFEALKKINNKDGKMMLQADQDLPYNTIRKVLYTASMAGFPNLKLVTIAGE